MNKKLFLTGLFIAFLIRLYGQNSPTNGTELVTNIPIAPTAASLGKYGDIKPDICTGIPKIEIPLYQIKSGDITVPISLSYNSGGIKVEELASWVGLGWSLNCGGVITRSQRGIPDEASGGFQSSGTRADIASFRAGTMTPTELQNFKVDILQKVEDSEPDLYYFNFGGYSGSFFTNNDGNFISSPRKHWKIELVTGGIKITTENGLQYLFTAAETTDTETSNYGSGDDPDPTFVAVSAWYLTQIMDTKGNKVTFNYTGTFYGFATLGAQTEFVPTAGSIGTQTTNTYRSSSNIFGQQLSSITFNGGTVLLTPSSSARQDAGENALQSLKVTNNNGVVVKNFAFYTSYFGPAPGGDQSLYRLRLDSVREESTITSHHLAPYKFQYNNSSVSTVSISQDSWGFYNGKPNSLFVSYQNPDGSWGGADRSIDHSVDQVYILQSITYPTGGYTQFTYEGNDYGSFLPASNSSTSIATLNGDNTGATSDPYTFSTSFTISSSDYYNGHSFAVVKPDYTIVYGPNPGHALCAVTLTLTGPGGTVTITDTTGMHLAAGSYTLSGSIETDVAGTPTADVSLSMDKQAYVAPHWATITGPGVRVNKIANFIGAKEEDKFYNYNVFGQSYSSGTINDLPGFSYAYTSVGPSPPTNADYTVFSSGSNYPLINFNSSYVVYANVTETNDASGLIGKTEYTYTNFTTDPDVIDYDFPFVPNRSYGFERGLITDKKDYKWTGSAFNPVHEDLYEYLTDGESFSTADAAYGLKIGTNVFYTYATTIPIILSGTVLETYFNTSDIFFQRKQKSREYDAGGVNYTEKTVGYDIDPTTLETNSIFENQSNGKAHTTKITFPENYSLSGSSAPDAIAIEQMKSTHITNPPVEKVTWLKSSPSATDSTVIAAELKEYKVTSVTNSLDIASVPLLQKDYPLGNNSPLTDFAPYTSATMDSRYFLSHTLAYNAQGNISSVLNLSNSYTGYQWGYLNQYPVAEVKNATDVQFFQQNFEETSGSTSGGAHTGNKYWGSTTYTVPWTVPDARSYVLSYWYLLSGVWTYSGEIAYTGSVTLSVSGASGYDDIRVYPKDAQITTFTYEPLLGVTTITDTKGETSYYEYDEFQRLMNIKDKDGNIIKNFVYHYQNQ